MDCFSHSKKEIKWNEKKKTNHKNDIAFEHVSLLIVINGN